MDGLTDRQIREVAFHSKHAELFREARPTLSYDVLTNPTRRWWNHYWAAYSILLKMRLARKSVLVPGCGGGFDAIRLSKLGASIYAFDISSEMLEIARDRATEEGVVVDFETMAAEQLSYADNSFDVIVLHDVLHHCDLKRALPEFVRVAKPGAFVLIDELYTHGALQQLREAKFGRWLHSKVTPYVYPTGYSYITDDERKLNQGELVRLQNILTDAHCEYYGMLVNRFVPPWDIASKIDRLLLKALGPLGFFFAGRFILCGSINK